MDYLITGNARMASVVKVVLWLDTRYTRGLPTVPTLESSICNRWKDRKSLPRGKRRKTLAALYMFDRILQAHQAVYCSLYDLLRSIALALEAGSKI